MSDLVQLNIHINPIPRGLFMTQAILVLQNGAVFKGRSIGAEGMATGEVVFNTAMTGYQEILTDPSYRRQIVTLTYPHIGNTGINDQDIESDQIHAAGLVIRNLPLMASNWRCQRSLEDELKSKGIPAIADIDTRRLTRILRDQGAQNGCIMAGHIDESEALQQAQNFPGLKGMDLAKEVSTRQAYDWHQGTWNREKGYPVLDTGSFKVVVYDYGVKYNILRMLKDRGCQLTVVPAQTPAEEVLALEPDGVFLSNGPGDPAACHYAIASIQKILDRSLPLFGICLGYQLLALACGAQTVKMKFGHHGANHPVQDLNNGRVMISSQNHGFAVDSALPSCLKATHISLFDRSLQGIHHRQKPAFGFQGHPEASPGPHDIAAIFDHFIALMRG